MKKNSMLFIMISLTAITLFLTACSSTDSATSSDNNTELPEGYPDKPVEFTIGYEPGGNTDLVGRTAAKIFDSMDMVDQSITIQNNPGSNGALATKSVIQKDDPYTLKVTSNLGEGSFKDGSVEFSDIKPIAAFSLTDVFIAVPGDSPFENVEELLEGLKEEPDMTVNVSGGTDGVDAFDWHVLGEKYGIEDFNIVPGGGSADTMQALVSGQDDAAFGTPAAMMDYITTEDLKLLAVLSEERSEYFPDVPTLKEATDLDMTKNRLVGLWASGNVSDGIVDYWEEKFKELTNTDEWSEFSEENKISSHFIGAEEYTDLIEERAPEYREYIENLED